MNTKESKEFRGGKGSVPNRASAVIIWPYLSRCILKQCVHVTVI